MNKANLILYDGKKSNQAEEHVTFRFVMREDPVSEELKAATIAGMKQRLEAKKQREASRRLIAKRIVAAAAIVLVLLFITPLGGYVTSAAESLFSSVSDWVSSVFKISNSRVDADEEERFRIDITEAKLVNDSLFISVKTNNDLLELSATGKLYDEKGNSVPIYSEACKAGNIGSLEGNNGWRLYAPDWHDVIQSPEGNYRCSLTVTALLEADDLVPDHKEKKHFDFLLENVDSFFNVKRYQIGKRIKINGAVFDFSELLVSESAQTVVVSVTREDGKAINDYDSFGAELAIPVVEFEEYGEKREFSGDFYLSGAYKVSKAEYLMLYEFCSNYQYYEDNTDYYHFHEFVKPPYQIIIRSVTYNKIVSEKREHSQTESIEYGKLPEIYLPIEYNKRGEIETKYEDVSFTVTGGVSIRLEGIEKNRPGRYGYEFADKKPDYKLNFTVDQGEMMPITLSQAGKHAEILEGTNHTTRSGEFPVVFSAMSKGREVFRLRCKMNFDYYETMTLENGHYVNRGVIWLDRPYEEFVGNTSYGEVLNTCNIIADDMNVFKNALGDYPSLRAIFKRCHIDTLRLVSISIIVSGYETKYDADSYDPYSDPNYDEYEKWQEAHMWYHDVTMADPTYYDFSKLPKEAGGSYTDVEWRKKTSKVNLTVTAKEKK